MSASSRAVRGTARGIAYSRPAELVALPAILTLGTLSLLLLIAVRHIDWGVLAFGSSLGLAIVLLAAWRPALGCGAILLGVPLSAGLGRGTVIPLLRPSEALVLLVFAGVALREITLPRIRSLSSLDLAVGALCFSGILVPWIVLTLTPPVGQDMPWQALISPLQYFMVYWLFSRADLTQSEMRFVLNVAMLAGVIDAAVGILQLTNVPGVRGFTLTSFPPSDSLGYDPLYRPNSLLEHFAGFGGFEVVTYALALALASTRQAEFPTWWLRLVILATVAGVLASQTWAPLVGLALTTAVMGFYTRSLPREVGLALAGLLVVGLAFLPSIKARAQQQGLFTGSASSLAIPETMDVRFEYWRVLFIPALLSDNRVWLGSGTLIPPEIPAVRKTFVDNEYLSMGFRSGVIGVGLLLSAEALLFKTAAIGRQTSDWRRPLGACMVGALTALMIMGFTAEYLTFVGISQLFWALAGLLDKAGADTPFDS